MKLRLMAAFVATLTTCVAGCSPKAADANRDSNSAATTQPATAAELFRTRRDSQSYAAGVEMIRGARRSGIELDAELVILGIRDAVRDANSLRLGEGQLRDNLTTFTSEMLRGKAQRSRMVGMDNKKEGEEFLAANKTKEGVVSLPSGLQYKILRQGKGAVPAESDTVEVHYRGSLLNGMEFDSTYVMKQPVMLEMKDVIPGWREALKRMPVGSKWQLFVPYQLAYGMQGCGHYIGPNACLIYEIELFSVKPKDPSIEEPGKDDNAKNNVDDTDPNHRANDPAASLQ